MIVVAKALTGVIIDSVCLEMRGAKVLILLRAEELLSSEAALAGMVEVRFAKFAFC